MPENKQLSVLVDTSFLISLYDDSREHHENALKYFKYFLKNGVKIFLSTVVIQEFHQKQTILDLIKTGNYQILPFNFDEAIAAANISHDLGNNSRMGSRPEYRDDIKIIGQAKAKNIDFIITEDESTLAKYCASLRTLGVLSTKIIIVNEGYDVSVFNGGQQELIPQ